GCSWNGDGAGGPVLHTRVLVGEPEALARHPRRSLLLVWPPHPSHEREQTPGFVSFGRRCLLAYNGMTVVYVGEPRRVGGPGGRPSWTADDSFFEDLRRDFVCRQWVAIPRWPGIEDSLWILDRRRRGR